MKSRSIAFWLGMLGLLALPAGLAAQDNSQPRYRVVELGTLGGTYSQTFYVTNKGVASGEAAVADGSWHAILYQGRFKKDLGNLVADTFAPIRERTAKILADPGSLDALLTDGARRARAIAGETMATVRDRSGLPPVA